jgi:cytochrome d ubiquinol oxidase subunit II
MDTLQILQIIWFFLVGVLLIGYSILDGFDLGVASLSPFIAKNEKETEQLITAIGPVWDGNEVWLLTGGGALFAAFPNAYATVFSGFYLALMLVLFALIFRAVSMEFWMLDVNNRGIWKIAFSLGSFLPALLYGVALGNIILGIPIDNKMEFTGTFFTLLRPFPLSIGLLGLAAILMQGATYAMLKTKGDIHKSTKELADKIWIGYLILLAIAVIFSFIFLNSFISVIAGWISLAVVIAALILLKKFINSGKEFAAFLMSSLSFIGLWGMAASYLFPNLVVALDPANSITIANSSSQLTLTVMAVIAIVGMPVVIAYTTFVYRVFKGKVSS